MIICYMYIREWQEKCNYKKECMEQEHQIDMQQLEINKLKKQLAKILLSPTRRNSKQSLQQEKKRQQQKQQLQPLDIIQKEQ